MILADFLQLKRFHNFPIIIPFSLIEVKQNSMDFILKYPQNLWIFFSTKISFKNFGFLLKALTKFNLCDSIWIQNNL